MAIVFGIALLLLCACIVAAHMMGFRYIVVDKLDGTQVKFAGKVDNDGKMLMGTIIYPDGARATVDETDGSILYDNGSVYSGDLNEIYEREGNGTLTLKNGDRYTGQFAADKLNGQGTYRYSNGDVYVGEFVNNVKQGQGKYTYADGSTYEGGFNLDARHGKGKSVMSDGTLYDGEYEMGLKWGLGTYVYANGDVYTGEFSYDMRNGKGTYTWADGEKYTGEFKNNNINGYGTYVWTGGRASYTGYFVNGEIVLVDPAETAPEVQKTGD